MKVRIGIDIGGTKTSILMISKDGKILAKDKIVTDSDKVAEPIVERASQAVEDLIKKEKVRKSSVEAIAVGIAGFANPKTGIIDISPNLHWHKVPFKAMMEKRLGRTVYMANDVSAAAWGEFVYGAGKDVEDMIAVFIGSGIGGGIVTNGKLVEGGTGTAGEVGHQIFRPNGLKCDCGYCGCFEAYGGGMPMERRARNMVKRGLSPMMLKLAGNDVSKVNTATIRKAAEKNDKAAKKIWDDVELSLGILHANLTSVFNPDKIVLGGGVISANPGLIKTIEKTTKERAVSLTARHVKIVKSKLGGNAIAMGAAALVDTHR
jgi:glucokinase